MKRVGLQGDVRFYFVILLSLCAFFEACSVQKRHYRKGFYVHAREKNHNKEAVPENNDRALLTLDKAGPSQSIFPSNTPESDLSASSEKCRVHEPLGFREPVIDLSPHQRIFIEHKKASVLSGPKEQRRKVELMGILGFLASVAGWLTLIYLPIGFLQAILFGAGAILAALSMRKMSIEPGRYLLKTLSFVGLLLALIGLAVMLYAGLIYLLS
jgi:hypothetical protein